MIQCWAEKYCKGFPDKCDIFCEGFVPLQILYNQSNIPLRYQYPKELTIEPIDSSSYTRVWEIQSDIRNWVNGGNNLLLWGEGKGNGKTTLAGAISSKYIRERVHDTDLTPVVYFIKSAKFLEEVRQQFTEVDPSFSTKLKLIETLPLLIIDDIGAEKSSEWVRERLLNIIDERYSNKLSTIYTSNCSLGQIAESLGSRIADRLRDCEQLQFKGTSKRGAK